MATLFDIGHESDLSEYDSTVTDGGDLSQGSPGLAGTSGRMEALIDDTTAIYGEVTLGAAYSDFRVRFYIHPNTMTIGSGDSFIAVKAQGGINDYLAEIVLGYDGSSFEVRFICRDDSDDWKTGTMTNISDAEHYIEFHVVRATDSGSSDGTVDWWIDRVHIEQVSSIDNYDQMGSVGWIQMGACRSLDSGTSGTLHLDELKGNDDGSEIGPISGAADAMPMAMHHYRTRRI